MKRGIFFSLKELASLTGSKLVGNENHQITNVAGLAEAQATDASFFANPRYLQMMQQSKAGVIFVASGVDLDPHKNYLINEDPSLAFQLVVELFLKDAKETTGFEGIHPTAVIHETAKLGDQVEIGPYAVIDKNVVIGNNTRIGSHSYVGPYTMIGSHCVIHPQVAIRERCLIGNRVILQPGAVIGSCGFGVTTTHDGKPFMLNQVGTVTLEDDVEIGANTTVDRARFKTTLIKRGTKIDYLVQIGHNVILGEENIIIAQTGIAGSTTTGKRVVMGGQTGVAGHLKIHDGVTLSGRSGVSKSLVKPGKYNGVPCMPIDEYNRNAVLLKHIDKYVLELKELKKRLDELEGKS